jgi:hypothetical protein
MTAQPALWSEPGAPRPLALRTQIANLVASRGLYPLFSLIVLAPCYWQTRIQAGDLSSHIYNAWLAWLIRDGHAPGLEIVFQKTNILFDLLLSALLHRCGPEAAQRIAVSLVVLVFVWGAFAFVCAVSRTRPLYLLPSIAMLAYGWVFHMGLFNFYLSLGLSFWVLALAWNPTVKRVAIAAPMAVLAYTAHALPLAWALGLLAYVFVARRIRRKAVTAIWVFSLVLLHIVLTRAFVTRWSPRQFASAAGLDQVWVFDGKYFLIVIGMLLFWGLLFLERANGSGIRSVLSGLPFQICLISAAAVFLVPGTILIPGFRHALVYIAERMSLAVGICACAMLAGAPPRAFVRYGLLALTLLFFGFLYRDERALNAFEDRMLGVVAGIAPGQRVVSGVDDPDLRANALTHMIDRVCMGRCYSYANYEPSTAQFRIRANAGNPFVISDYGDSFALQRGTYVPKEREVPMLKVDLENGKLVLRNLKAGTPCGIAFCKVLPELLPGS